MKQCVAGCVAKRRPEARDIGMPRIYVPRVPSGKHISSIWNMDAQNGENKETAPSPNKDNSSCIISMPSIRTNNSKCSFTVNCQLGLIIPSFLISVVEANPSFLIIGRRSQCRRCFFIAIHLDNNVSYGDNFSCGDIRRLFGRANLTDNLCYHRTLLF